MLHEPDNSSDLLAEWCWLLRPTATLASWSSSGDLFVATPGGAIARLDTGGGDLELVAASRDEFRRALEDPEQAENLLLLPVVRDFEASEGRLGAGECLGFRTLPVFGGAYTVENRVRRSIAEHAGFTGDVHRQIRDLLDGAQVRLKVIP